MEQKRYSLAQLSTARLLEGYNFAVRESLRQEGIKDRKKLFETSVALTNDAVSIFPLENIRVEITDTDDILTQFTIYSDGYTPLHRCVFNAISGIKLSGRCDGIVNFLNISLRRVDDGSVAIGLKRREDESTLLIAKEEYAKKHYAEIILTDKEEIELFDAIVAVFDGKKKVNHSGPIATGYDLYRMTTLDLLERVYNYVISNRF